MCMSFFRKFTCVFLISLVFAGLYCSDPLSPYITDLRVEDAPDDDGTGLIVKFTPMSPDFHILEYRIYRGVHPDTLFYIGKVEVDPKTVNLNADIMFSDKDWRPFVDLESPARLRKEKQQTPDSPIYGPLPRDINLVSSLLDRFSTLAIISNHNFYKKSQKIIVPNEENDNELYAGLRIEDFETIVEKLKPNHKYYYSVIPVNHTRTFLSYCPPVLGVPYDNLPLATEHFYPVYLSDTNTLNIEFELQFYIANIYMLHQSELPALQNYKQYMSDLDSYNKLIALHIAEGDTLATPPLPPEPVENPGKLLAEIYGQQIAPYGKNLCSIKYQDGHLISDKDASEIPFEPDQIDSYLFYMALNDFTFEAVSTPVHANIALSADLPTLPDFYVRNKPDSKGDTFELLLGKPYAMISQFSFRGRSSQRRKLSVAYSYNPSPLYQVKSITFDFYDIQGYRFNTHTEYFFDNVFNLNLPNDKFVDEGFSVIITLNTPQNSTIKTSLSQNVSFDDEMMSFRPGHLYIDEEDTLRYKYQILRKARSMEDYAIVSTSTPLLNVFDDIIPFEDTTYKMIASADKTKKLLLVDSEVELYDDEYADDGPFTTSIFLDDYKEFLKTQIDKYTQIINDNPDDNDTPRYLSYFQSLLDMQTEHPLATQINSDTSHQKRVAKILNMLDLTNRSSSYLFAMTDERGMFVISDVFTDNDGKQYLYPRPSWFKSDGWPMLIASVLFGLFVFYFYNATKRGKHTYIRPIAGLEEVDNAIGRATEMGNPILFVPGLTSIDDVATLAGLSILGHITKKAAEYDTRILVPVSDYIVLPIAQQIVKESHYAAGRPDSFNPNDVFFVAEDQFAFVAGVNGIMIRQKTAANFYLGMFFAESLVMTETGNNTGAIQIAGTDAVTQIPFFITTCDYTLIGEEFYASSAYLSRDPVIIGTLKSQDVTKLLIILCVLIGTILSTFHINTVINWFPTE